MNRSNWLRVAIAAGVAFLVGTTLMRGAGEVVGTATAPSRHYYLTKATVNGNAAKTACTTGYHFASFAELNDTSNLTYNKTLGRNAPDSGQGPPQLFGSTALGVGWIRTGGGSNATVSSGDNVTPSNCNTWSTANTGEVGEVAFFALYGFASTGSPPALNFRNNFACDNSNATTTGVWCIEN
jgi:hypothetical protein